MKDGPLSPAIGFTLMELHELRRAIEFREVNISAKLDAQRRYPVKGEVDPELQSLIEQYVHNRSLHTWACESIVDLEQTWMADALELPTVPGWTNKTEP